MYILRPNLVYETSTASDRDGVNGFTIAKIWSKIDIKRTILNICSTPQMETNASTRGRKNGLVWFLYQGLRQMVQQQKLCSFPLMKGTYNHKQFQNGKIIRLTEISRSSHCTFYVSVFCSIYFTWCKDKHENLTFVWIYRHSLQT